MGTQKGMEFDGFTTIDFLPRSGPGFVYVLCWVAADKREIPFYVGETQSAWGRLNDYYWADFQASTDFNVGEAVKYLYAKNCRVVAKYKPSANQVQEQDALIATLRAGGYALLNREVGYDYKRSSEPEQRLRVQAFVDKLLATNKTAQEI